MVGRQVCQLGKSAVRQVGTRVGPIPAGGGGSAGADEGVGARNLPTADRMDSHVPTSTLLHSGTLMAIVPSCVLC